MPQITKMPRKAASSPQIATEYTCAAYISTNFTSNTLPYNKFIKIESAVLITV